MKRSIIILFIISFVVSGCTTASRISSPFDFKQLHEKPADFFNEITLGVEPWKDGSWSSHLDQFVKVINNTSMFREIDYVDNLSKKPDLIISNFQDIRHYRSGSSWLLYNVSLGIIPVFFSNDIIISFSLSSPDISEKIDIEFSYKTEHMKGLFALPYRLGPKWSSNTIKYYEKVLITVFMANQSEIENLL